MAHYGKSGNCYGKLGNNNPNRRNSSGGGGGAKIPAYSTAYSTDMPI
jgi:hypothetical protein